MSPAATDPAIDTLRDAVTVIHDVAFAHRDHTSATIGAAHDTVARHRHHHTGPIRDAIDAYFDDLNWQQGPHVLRAAIDHLAHQLDIPDPALARIAEQPSLF